MNRRWLLRALVALPFVPLATKVASALELGKPPPVKWSGWTYDVIAATIESRSRAIAYNVSKNNELLAWLRTQDARERAAQDAMTDEQKRQSILRELEVRRAEVRSKHRLDQPRNAWDRDRSVDMHARTRWT